MRPLMSSRPAPGLASDRRCGFSLRAARLSLVDCRDPAAESPHAVLLDCGELVAAGQVGTGRTAILDSEDLDITVPGRLAGALAGKPL
jgi:hypothetical protein